MLGETMIPGSIWRSQAAGGRRAVVDSKFDTKWQAAEHLGWPCKQTSG